MVRLKFNTFAMIWGTMVLNVGLGISASVFAVDGATPSATPTARPSRTRASFPARKIGAFSYDYALFSLGVEGGISLGGSMEPRATIGPELVPIRYGLTTQSPSGFVLDADVKAGSFYLDIPGGVQPGFESEIIRTRVGGSLLIGVNQDHPRMGNRRLKCSPAASADLMGFAYSKPAINGQLGQQDSDTALMALQVGPSWICNDARTYVEAMPYLGVGGSVRESVPTDPDLHWSAGLHTKILRTDDEGLAKTLAVFDAEHRWSSFLTDQEAQSNYEVRAVFDQRITPRHSWMLGGEVDISMAPESEIPAAASAKVRASYAW